MSLRSKVLSLCLFVSIIGIIAGYFLLTQTHQDFTNSQPIAEFEAYEFNDFVSALTEQERGEIGNEVYAVEGKVESMAQYGFIIAGGIVCTTSDSTNLGVNLGDEIKVKGRFVSFDNLFSEVRLDHVVTM